METLLLNFKYRLRKLLPHSEQLQIDVIHALLKYCSPQTREILALGTPSFFRILVAGGQWETVFCLHYSGSALICQAHYWECLDETCKLIHTLTGITTIYVRGVDVCHQCCLQDGNWVREAVP